MLPIPDDTREAARAVFAVQGAMAARGSHLAKAALAGARAFVEWEHYPHDDCVDRAHGTEFYYHAHDAARRAAAEHGHFHVFARHDDGRFWHLAGISLDNRGRATRLFTTNRWVTAEAWAPAAEMLPRLDAFALESRGRLAPVARWIQAMMRLYRPLIAELLNERDAWLAGFPSAQRKAALDDRSVHIVSQRPIDVFADLDRNISPRIA